MKKILFLMMLASCFAITKAHAQSDSTDDSLRGMRIRYYSVSNDSVRLNVVNANRVTIKQYKDHNLITVYPLIATEPKNKIDTTIKNPL